MIDATGSRWTWHNSLALGMIALAAWLVLSAREAQLSQALPPEPALPSLPAAPGISATPTWQQEEPWVVRAYYVDRRQVDELAAWIEPWEVVDLAPPGRELGYVIVDVDQAGLDRLRQAGFRLEIDERLTDQLHRPNARLLGQTSGIPGYPCYRTVEETFATAQGIAAAHPELATWIDIGDSWQKTQDPTSGYDLMVLRLTDRAVPGPKPKLLVTASIHAREYAPAELATRFAEYMVARYGTDPDVTWLLDDHEIHILLQANPDGRKQAEGGLYWRKNTDDNYCTGTTMRGADLNRNFEYQWGGWGASSSVPCDEVYRGPAPASEPETRAIQDYMRALFPDQREDTLDAPAPAMPAACSSICTVTANWCCGHGALPL